jgi:micrococcal nuclease
VSDGDTVHVLNQSNTKHKIRLGGIDAPEKKQAFGQKSKQNLSRLIASKNIEVEYTKRDQYKRIIGKLIYQGQGKHCHHHAFYSGRKYQPIF